MWTIKTMYNHINIATYASVILPDTEYEDNSISDIPLLNYLRSGKPINIDLSIKKVVCGEDYSILLDEANNPLVFGNNKGGQLGLGHIYDIEKPMIIPDLKGKVKDICSSGDINLALTNDNEVYIWPLFYNKNIFRPTLLYLNKKIIISAISCGNNFVIILSKQGIVYSLGNCNKYGELGHGDNNPRNSVTPIQFLKDNGDKIVQISCGYKHVIAKNTLNKVYTWGSVIYLNLELIWSIRIRYR